MENWYLILIEFGCLVFFASIFYLFQRGRIIRRDRHRILDTLRENINKLPQAKKDLLEAAISQQNFSEIETILSGLDSVEIASLELDTEQLIRDINFQKKND